MFDNQVSAKKGTNVDTLLENIVLIAEVFFALTYVVFPCFVLPEGPLPEGQFTVFVMVLIVREMERVVLALANFLTYGLLIICSSRS